MKKILLGFSFFLFVGLNAQVDKKVLNWYNGKSPGMNTEKAYKKLLKGKKSNTVVVAVIDSGVDVEHEDLKGSIWVNKGEIPDNNIDDDKNGYVDDIYGWSFLCNKDGEDLNDENLEMVRIYKKLNVKFDGVEEADVADGDKESYALYQEVSGIIHKKVAEYEGIKGNYEMLLNSILPMLKTTLTNKFGSDYTLKDVKKWEVDASNQMDVQMKNLAIEYVGGSFNEKMLEKGIEHMNGSLDFHYNVDFEARQIVGDNPDDFSDTDYGCNRVEGPDALHGTHVSGIICATRGNGIGNDGVADNVQIMALRAVPNGDERDKDIALAIRYAVDNGAKVINMSFGKSYSPNSKEVYEALKYANDHDVLMIHAAGNDNTDIDEGKNYPKARYEEGELPMLLTIGASTRYLKLDDKTGHNLAASFSNYGIKSVDVFAPGLEIYSTVPDNKYLSTQGTSMAAPMVAGVAALIKSYFPELTMRQVRDIIVESGSDYSSIEVSVPGKEEKTNFAKLSITGRVVNVYNCILKAQEIK